MLAESAIEGLEGVLGEAVEKRRQDLVAEGRSMNQQLKQREGTQTPEWLQELDDLPPRGFDLLTVTVLWPD